MVDFEVCDLERVRQLVPFSLCDTEDKNIEMQRRFYKMGSSFKTEIRTVFISLKCKINFMLN